MIGFFNEYKRKKAFAAALKLREGRAMQQPQFPGYGELRSVGFLCELEKGGDPQQVADIVASFRKEGLPYKGMVLETGSAFKDEAAREEFAALCRSNNVVFIEYRLLGGTGIPQEPQFSENEEVKAFFATSYNLFVNLNRSGSFTLDLLALGADAQCLAGMCNNTKMPYTLVMEAPKEDFSFSRYINALFSYLKTINAPQAQ